jgi:cephalosporin hydroxylase
MNLKKNFDELDEWTRMLSPIQYMPTDTVQPAPNLTILPLFGIQQVKKELEELSNIIVSQSWFENGGTILEIGLGHYGSSHLFWRGLFSNVITIEKNHERVNRFSENILKFYKKWVLNDKSKFVIGSSQDPLSVSKVYNTVDSIDFLFIDGDHSYKSVLSDWLLYSPLVSSGGMVVFHDAKETSEEGGGVPRLISELEAGRFGQKYKLQQIAYSDQVGVSYYIKE